MFTSRFESKKKPKYLITLVFHEKYQFNLKSICSLMIEPKTYKFCQLDTNHFLKKFKQVLLL